SSPQHMTPEEAAYRTYAARYVIPPSEQRGLTEKETEAIHLGKPDPRFPTWYGKEGEQSKLEDFPSAVKALRGDLTITTLQAALEYVFFVQSPSARRLTLSAVFAELDIPIWSICSFQALAQARQADRQWKVRGGPLYPTKRPGTEQDHVDHVTGAAITAERTWRSTMKRAGRDPISPTVLRDLYERRAGGPLLNPGHVYEAILTESVRTLTARLMPRFKRYAGSAARLLMATLAFVFVPGWGQPVPTTRPLDDETFLVDTLAARLRQRLARRTRRPSTS
ncbi:MAG TPA: hypothetical protein VFQ26_01310, partial [Nitrospiraceae bacterium]|nr:hypothetical protein [Nitrospiraceae bacterium]